MATTTHTPPLRPRSGRVAAGASTYRRRTSATVEHSEETGGGQFGWWALTVLGPMLLVAAGSLWAPSTVLALIALVAWGMLDAEEAWT